MTDAGKPSVTEQIEKLESLRASGSLTDDEFRNLKSAVILKELQANSPRNVVQKVIPDVIPEEPPVSSSESFSKSSNPKIELPANNTTRRAVIAAVSLVAVLVVAILVGSQMRSGLQQGDASQQQADRYTSASSGTADTNSPLPPDEAKFVDAVASARTAYNSAPNDMAKGGTRGDRRTGICQVLQDSRSVNGWIGTIKSLSSNGDGKGVLAITIADDVVVGTWNNAISDVDGGTLMDQASPVFKAASAMKEGDKVQFSGTFVPSDVDCVRESSLTLEGSMQSPDFVMRFDSV